MRYFVEYKQASPEDVDFCVETYVNAEKANSEVFPFSKVFDIPEEDSKKILREIMLEDIEGQEMAISSFTLLMHGKNYAGACGSFVECINGISSNIIKSDILRHFIPKKNFEKAIPVLKMLKPFNFYKEPLSVHFESLYIKKEYRSIELYLEMVKTIGESRIAQYPELNLNHSYAGFSERNWFMGKAASRIGYVHYMTTEITNKEALKYVSGLKRIVVMKQH